MEVGLRVVRGPDWNWQSQDDGEGHVGTLVEIGKPGSSTSPDKTVVIQWDSGSRTNYRVGYQNSFDLRVLDNAAVGVKHQNIKCNNCNKQGIQGIRWSCAKCRDFDLCHACYLNEKHDLGHQFMRIDTPSSIGIKVSKRTTATKVSYKGIYNGATVVRGPDWDWGNQDGGDGKPGKVLDIRGWDRESGRSVANVKWDSGSTNVYRLGHKGKVDLKYIKDAVGGFYYKEHLPVLGNTGSSTTGEVTKCIFRVGDKVRVDLDEEILKAMQEGHGGWNPRMAEYLGKVGSVHRITERGDVRVSFEGCANRWTFHPGALTKVHHYSVGDIVKVSEDVQLVRDLQKGHGEWTDNMKKALAKSGKVLKVYADGDLRVSVASHIWTFNPACVKRLPHGQQDINNTLGLHERREDHTTALTAILDQLLLHQPPSAEPDRLVREAAQGHVDLVREIIAKHPDKVDLKGSGKTALQVACHQGHVEIVKLLLGTNANLEIQDEDGDTALHYSSFGNQPEITELLLAKGAKINAVNKGGCSTLHVAVNKQHTECVKILLRHGCDVNIQDSYGDTALHDAIGKDNRDITDLLIDCPMIDFKFKNKRGFNVLHHAALKGNNYATQKILQKARQTVDIKKDDGFAALHLAALNGHKDVADTLLEMGKADIEIRNNRNQTPLLLAVSQGHVSIMELLVSKGADVNVEDEDGDTCLHLAFMRQTASEVGQVPGLAKICQQLGMSDSDKQSGAPIACYLIQNGANLDQKNAQGKSPLEVVSNSKLQGTIRQYASSCEKPRKDSLGGGDVEGFEECMVCCDVAPDVVFEPCGHSIVCSGCCVKMKKCLVCMKLITKKVPQDKKGIHSNGASNLLNKPNSKPAISTVDDLKKKVQEMEDSIICSICLDSPRSVAFLCGHSACTVCAQPLKVCHMCRKPISRKINLFT